MMKFIVPLFLSLVFVFGCMESKPDNVEVRINFELPPDTTCETYLADYFELSIYDSTQKKISTKQINCGEKQTITLFMERQEYYATVILFDKEGYYQSYGSKSINATEGDTETTVKLDTYLGGVFFTWNTSDCKKFTLSYMNFTMRNEGEPVTAKIWGEDVVLDGYRIPCLAARFELINISPDPKYFVTIEGFREESDHSRIIYDIPEFISGRGQNKVIDINKFRKVTVSDMQISWEFDSKSIESCEAAGVKNVVAKLVSEEQTIQLKQPCDNKYADFYLYDIGNYDFELVLTGLGAAGEALFETSKHIGVIEPGSIYDDILKEHIYLEEIR